MARTKATVRGMPPTGGQQRYKKRFILSRLKKPYMQCNISKTVNITKNGQIVKTINIRRKSKYFSRKID